MTRDYTRIEQRLYELLSALSGILSDAESSEVAALLTAGEYGVAFESMCEILVERNAEAPSALMAKFSGLAEEMALSSDTWSRVSWSKERP